MDECIVVAFRLKGVLHHPGKEREMSPFDHLQRKRSTSSTRAAPTSRWLRSCRPFAPAPVPMSEHASPDQQAQPTHGTRLKYSLADIPLFPPERENSTGLSDNLKAGIENLSGLSVDDVKVHYNSSKPAQVQALAYTQGTDIHVGPGQEKHLAHEAWHVVQQKQGRVKPTLQAKRVAINDDEGLEAEAGMMGRRTEHLKKTMRVDHSTSSLPLGAKNSQMSQEDFLPVHQGIGPRKPLIQRMPIPARVTRLDKVMESETDEFRQFVSTCQDWKVLENILDYMSAVRAGRVEMIGLGSYLEDMKLMAYIGKKIEELKEPEGKKIQEPEGQPTGFNVLKSTAEPHDNFKVEVKEGKITVTLKGIEISARVQTPEDSNQWELGIIQTLDECDFTLNTDRKNLKIKHPYYPINDSQIEDIIPWGRKSMGAYYKGVEEEPGSSLLLIWTDHPHWANIQLNMENEGTVHRVHLGGTWTTHIVVHTRSGYSALSSFTWKSEITVLNTGINDWTLREGKFEIGRGGPLHPNGLKGPNANSSSKVETVIEKSGSSVLGWLKWW